MSPRLEDSFAGPGGHSANLEAQRLGFPFAKLLPNFCGTKRKMFLSLCISFARKKTTICAIIRKSHFTQNCPIPLLQNSSFVQFRNFVPKSETDCPVKVSTILVLDMHIS